MKKTYTLSKIFCALLLISEFAFALDEQNIKCYQVPVQQSPDSISQQDDLGSEIWCYKKLNADKEHEFVKEIDRLPAVTHVRLNIFPDGGISRLRLFGKIKK